MKTSFSMKLLAALTALCLLLSFGAVYAFADDEPVEGPVAEDVIPADDAIIPEEEEALSTDEASAPAPAEGIPAADLAGDALTPEQQAASRDITQALDSGLYFKSGEFKILVLGDMNDGLFPYPAMLKYIQYVLEDVKPDLIVLNGDITREGASIFGLTGASIPWICDLFGDIPFTLTFGDQDALLAVSKNNYLGRYQKYANCLAYDDEKAGAPGVGNHNLIIFKDAAAAGTKLPVDAAFNLWLMDSNTNGLQEPQTAWYAIREEEGVTFEAGRRIPSALFTHFPLPELYNLPAAAGLSDPTWKLPAEHSMSAMMGTYGTVLAAVSGHHRGSAFSGTYNNMLFVQNPGLSHLSGSGTNRDTRGGTLITLAFDGTTASVASAQLLPMFDYFNDDNPAEDKIGSRHAFYKAGAHMVFGPLASFIGLCASLFTNKYDVTFSVTQFFGDTFNWML